MYIESLKVRNVRLLAEQEFSFRNPDGTPRLWTVIVGENGLCKSTILQLIALATMGPKLGSVLVPNAQRLRNLNSHDAASFTAKFDSVGEFIPSSLVSSLSIEADRFDLTAGEPSSGASLLDDLRAKRIPEGFVAGYGVGRFLTEPGETALPDDPVVDRVRGLFSPQHKMLGINFYSAFHSESSRSLGFLRSLNEALSIGGEPDERLLPGFLGIDLKGRRKSRGSPGISEPSQFDLQIKDRALRLPATWLSDGYQAMLSWIADLLGHALLAHEEGLDPRNLEGIVLLDEIDLHLHPTWQRRIVPLLRKIFPHLQFIVTTHSPLVLTGFERDEIILLKLREGEVVQDPAEIQPGVLTASEILTNFFGVQRAGRPELVRKERRYLELKATTRLSSDEQDELQRLDHELQPYLEAFSSTAMEMRSPEEILKRKV
ncbi:MAG TPA: AAA family ATPase [Thermoanaerobaculia bacterium]|nr:AAA family ATPase [Thermoanaerobaculia bacterium]